LDVLSDAYWKIADLINPNYSYNLKKRKLNIRSKARQITDQKNNQE